MYRASNCLCSVVLGALHKRSNDVKNNYGESRKLLWQRRKKQQRRRKLQRSAAKSSLPCAEDGYGILSIEKAPTQVGVFSFYGQSSSFCGIVLAHMISLKNIFGGGSHPLLKQAKPFVEALNALEDAYQQKTQEELRETTHKLRNRLASG